MSTGMNLIKRYADDYFNKAIGELTDSEHFISNVKRHYVKYESPSDKIEFMERIVFQLKNKYKRHLTYCSLNESNNCRFAKFYEAVLLYLQYELRRHENVLSMADFKAYERNDLSLNLKKIVERMSPVNMKNTEGYGTFIKEMDELNEYYFLNKKIWHQLLSGKLIDMIGNHVIEESVYEKIMLSVNTMHPELTLVETE